MRHLVLTILAVTVLSTGCARIEKVRAIEGDRTDVAYHSLGSLQVSQNTALAPANWLWGSVEVATLSLANTPSKGDVYKKQLKAQLESIAKRDYGADAVIHVEYWPDPDSESFPRGGTIYARGEMVRYREFISPEGTLAV